MGRFYQPDPITFLSGGHGQTNRYQYGWNDSYTFSDPNGTDVTTAFGGLLTESWYALTGQSYNFSNIKGALFDGYNGSGWDVTKSALGDCLNFCTLGFGSTVFNGLKLSLYEAKAFATGSKFVLPELKLSKPGYTYALTAQESGFYPIMKWGFKEPQGRVWLETGDIWKIGETINPSRRYSQIYLSSIGKGLDRQIISKEINSDAAKTLQNAFLRNYREVYGKLPPGNKGIK